MLPGGAGSPGVAILLGGIPASWGFTWSDTVFFLPPSDHWRSESVDFFPFLFFYFPKKELVWGEDAALPLLREKKSDSLALFRDRKITLSSEYSKKMK